MRATSEVVYDPSGWLSGFVQQAKGLRPDVGLIVADCFRLISIRLLFCFFALERGEVWRAIGYLGDVRVALMRVLRLTAGSYRPGVASDPPASGFEADMGRETLGLLLCTISEYGEDEVRRALQESASVAFALGLESLAVGLGPQELATARRIGALILGSGTSSR